jgi:SSS family solute:Na+ symporter
MKLAVIDWAILLAYFVFVLGIGLLLRRYTRTSEDFFLSGRSIPAWMAGLAFLSANLGAQEVIGMAASGAKYGIATSNFYWLGAIPAMVFLALFMMPFYYVTKIRSVPEYLKLRFDEKTRTLNAVSFALMCVVSSGISMYGMGLLLNIMFGWSFEASVSVSALIVLAYVFMGGLTSAIYNEVLQFFLIVFGFAPLVYLAMRDVGGWAGLQSRLHEFALSHGYAADAWTRLNFTSDASATPLGVEWIGLVMGLGFVLSFGYWCTDFLVVQRAMSARSLKAARMAPLIAAFPKIVFPFLVILPGMVAIALTHKAGVTGFHLPMKPDGTYSYDMVIPLMLFEYFPHGILGLGLTALMASFMSGMAGNVTALNTVWTYDLYSAHIKPGASDAHYLHVGRVATVVGIILSIGAAFVANSFNNIMDLLQLLFAFVNAPLFATFLLGMFWKRTTANGAFFGLLSGTLAAALHHGMALATGAVPGVKGGWLLQAVHYPSEMAMNFWTAIYAFSACFVVTGVVSLFTSPKPTSELHGLVYSLSERAVATNESWMQRPATWALFVVLAAAILNIAFW